VKCKFELKYGKFKECTKCSIELPISKFGIANSKKDQLRGDCKDCRKTTSKQWYESNKESRLMSVKKWRENNKNKVYENVKKWQEDNPDKVSEYQKKYYYNNLDKMAKKRFRRRKEAVPSWLTEEHKKEIKIIYDTCRSISLLEDKKFHVDHIIPIKGKNVSGLHVPWNLQIISATENLIKSNKS